MNFNQEIKALYPPSHGYRLNLFLNEDGTWRSKTRLRHTNADDLDLILLNHLRSISDLILTSGNTVRVEKYKPSKWAPIAVLSKSIGILKEPLFTQPNPKYAPIWITPKGTVLEPNNHSWQLNYPLDPVELSQKISQKSYHKILLETGSRITENLEPIITEICLTTTDQANIGSLIQTITSRKTEQVSELIAQGYSFTRHLIH